jgi:ribonucleoside-triphosphate reductase
MKRIIFGGMGMARTLAAIDKDIAETEAALDTVQGTETEVYARIVGYYRSLKNWNKGKKDEFTHRKTFEYAAPPAEAATAAVAEAPVPDLDTATDAASPRYELYARKTCPNCPPVKDYLAGSGLDGEVVDVDTPEGLKKAALHNVFSAPTVIFYRNGKTVGTAYSVRDMDTLLGKAA